MNLRITDRAWADIEALSPEEYENIVSAVKVIRSMTFLPGKPVAVVNDQYDIYLYEPPKGDRMIVCMSDPSMPHIGAFAGLWRHPGVSRAALKRMALEAAHAAGIEVPRIFIPG